MVGIPPPWYQVSLDGGEGLERIGRLEGFKTLKSYHYRRSSNSSAKSSGPGLFTSLSRLSKGFGGTAGLVVAMLILNFGVIQYHGDPRELFGLVGGESAEAAEEPSSKTSSFTKRKAFKPETFDTASRQSSKQKLSHLKMSIAALV